MLAVVKYPESARAYQKAYRQSGLTQDEIATRAGINPRQFKKYLAGDHRPYPQLRDRLASVLGVDPEALPSSADAGAPF